MSKKNNNTAEVQESVAKNTPKKKMTKKEKRAIAEQRTKELNQKKTRNYGIGFVFSLVAVAISFLYKPEVGTALWSYTQMGCYAIMGVAGFFLKNGAKYEENVKRAKTMDMIGLIFIVMCLGMIMAEAVALFMA
jgi:cation transport ATPase